MFAPRWTSHALVLTRSDTAERRRPTRWKWMKLGRIKLQRMKWTDGGVLEKTNKLEHDLMDREE